MADFSSSDIVYKKVLKKATDINVGEISKAIAADAGAMVKVSALNKFAKTIKDQGCKKPVIHVGVKSGNLIATVQDADGFKAKETIVKGYAKIKAAKATVIDADPKDATIARSAATMAKAKGTDAETAKDAKISGKTSGDIIILAHGSKSGGSSGTIYAKKFADKSASDIVNYISKKKKLPKVYKGVIYLDGCFTAAGPKQGSTPSELNNFCKKVYSGLVKAGYKTLQVRGNLGVASTKADGSESVVDAQMEAEVKAATKKAQKVVDACRKKSLELSKKLAPHIKKKMELEAALKKADSAAKKGLTADLKKIDAKISPLDKQYEQNEKKWKDASAEVAKIKADLKKKGVEDKAIKDLIGTFGPERL